MKNYIKAAYIFSLLPQHIKSHCLTSFTDTQRRLLEKGLTEITALPLQYKIAILTEFINSSEKLVQHQKHLLDISIIISLIIFCIIIFLSAIISHGWMTILHTFLFLLQYGALHALFTPLIIVYAQKVMQKPLFQIVKPSHIMYDISISFVAASVISMVFTITIPQETVRFSSLSILAVVFATTAVPISEELFFRGILFLHGGSRYGYIPSWFFVSFVFASIHLPHTPLEFASYFACSSMLCFVAYKFSLFASIVAHMLSNSILFML